MKWIEIKKAKVKFGQLYLVASPDLERPCTGVLKESKSTVTGIVHVFQADADPSKDVVPSHVALITNPPA